MSIVYLRVGPYTTLPPRQVRGHEPIPNAKMDPSPENRQTKKKRPQQVVVMQRWTSGRNKSQKIFSG
jgi:hypothetical protein